MDSHNSQQKLSDRKHFNEWQTVVAMKLMIEWNVIRSFDHLGGADSELESQGQISQKKIHNHSWYRGDSITRKIRKLIIKALLRFNHRF